MPDNDFVDPCVSMSLRMLKYFGLKKGKNMEESSPVRLPNVPPNSNI